MSKIKVILTKAHENQINNPDIRQEMQIIEDFLNEEQFELTKETVYLLFAKGVYRDFEKKMTSVLVFINKTGKTVNEIHGVVRLKHRTKNFQIANSTIDFDKVFLGPVEPDNAVLVHLNIPVRGLEADEEFASNEILGELSDVRVTFM